MAAKQPERTLYDRLVEHIFSGELVPGARVVEGQLAKEIGVSRIPVRESLRKMVGQGLLTSDADGSGIRVRKYTPEEIRQLYEFRECLEGSAASSAARSANGTDIARLKMICDQLEAISDDQEKWGDMDRAFHEALASASHNQRTSTALCNLLTECRFVFYILPKRTRDQSGTKPVSTKQRQKLASEHRKIFEAIRKGDADSAERYAIEHIHRGGERLIEQFLAVSCEP